MVGFFSESATHFLSLQISKKIFQKTILNLKFKFPTNNKALEALVAMEPLKHLRNDGWISVKKSNNLQVYWSILSFQKEVVKI